MDARSSHNFVSLEKAKKLGLKMKKERESIKIVSSAANLIHGLVERVRTTIREWDGLTNGVCTTKEVVLVFGFLEHSISIGNGNHCKTLKTTIYLCPFFFFF